MTQDASQKYEQSGPAPGVCARRLVRWLAYASLFGIGCFTVAILALHWLQLDLNPLDRAMSYYAHGSHGWLFTVGLFGLALGSFALTAGLARAVRGLSARAGQWLLVVWGVGGLLSGIFPADPYGNWSEPSSVSDSIHGIAGLVAVVAFSIGALLLARSFRGDLRWRRISTLLLTLAIITLVSLGALLVSLTPALISPRPPTLFGLIQRILFAVYLAWLGSVAIGLLQTTTDHE